MLAPPTFDFFRPLDEPLRALPYAGDDLDVTLRVLGELAEAQALYPCHWEELEPGLWRFWNDPVSGIGSMSYLLQSQAGNLMFEGCAAFSPEALAFIAGLGGVQVLSASHPHSYGALWQIQDRFDPELCLHPGDLAWSAAVCVTWPFDSVLEPLPGFDLHLTKPSEPADVIRLAGGPVDEGAAPAST